MPRPSTPAPVLVTDAPAVDDQLAAFLEATSQTGYQVKIFRRVAGVKPPGRYVGNMPIGEFCEEAIAARYGAGDYNVQAIDAHGRVQARTEVAIDPIVAPARRIMPPTYPMQSAPTFGGDDYPAHADPVAALARQVEALTRLVQSMTQQPGAMLPTSQGITVRDLFDLVKANQPTNLAGFGIESVITLLPKLLDMLKPKSTVQELIEAKRLMESMGNDEDRSEGSSDSFLMKLLDTPIGQALAAKLLADQPAASPAAPQRRLPAAPPPALPAAPQPAAQQPTPAAAVTPPAEPPMPDIVQAIVPLIVEGIRAAQASPAFDPQQVAFAIVDQCGGPDVIGEVLDQITPGQLADAVIAGGARPPALVYMIEGMVRTACAPTEDASPEPIEPTPAPTPTPPAPPPAPATTVAPAGKDEPAAKRKGKK